MASRTACRARPAITDRPAQSRPAQPFRCTPHTPLRADAGGEGVGLGIEGMKVQRGAHRPQHQGHAPDLSGLYFRKRRFGRLRAGA